MAAPNEEYDYGPITQVLECGEWRLVFGFYDHSLCGSCMHDISLCEGSELVINLRLDNPGDSGVPSLFAHEALLVLGAARSPSLSRWQMLALLAATNPALGSAEFVLVVQERFALPPPPAELWPRRFSLEDTRGGPPLLVDLNELYPLSPSRAAAASSELHGAEAQGLAVLPSNSLFESYRCADSDWMKTHAQDFVRFLSSL